MVTLTEAARLLLDRLAYLDALTMHAVMGGESSYRDDAGGDPLTAYPYATQLECASYVGPCSAGGKPICFSQGLLQANMCAHRAALAQATGSDDVAEWVRWLHNPAHNLDFTLALIPFDGTGILTNRYTWGAYYQGTYRGYLPASRQAIADVW